MVESLWFLLLCFIVAFVIGIAGLCKERYGLLRLSNGITIIGWWGLYLALWVK